MKITHYWPHLLALETGPGNAILGWCRALQRLGVEASVAVDSSAVVLPPPDDIPCALWAHRGRGHLRIPTSLGNESLKTDLLITHAGWVLANVVAGRAARRMGLPYLVMAHGVYNPQVLRRRALLKKSWFFSLEKPYLNRAAGVHVFFPDEVDHLAGIGIRAPAIVAPNGIDPPTGVTWDGGSGGFLLWIGRYDPENKGLDILLEALRSWPSDSRPRVHLHGRDWRGGRKKVSSMVEQFDLQRSVVVGDPVYGEEKWRTLATASGFVYPSRWEACPTAVEEAVSIGTPTLVADYPLGRRLASLGGAVMAGLTPSELRHGMERLLSQEARGVGEKGAEIASRELSWDAVAESWLSQVSSVMGIPRPVR